MSNENKTLTAAERAALANRREAEAQRRRAIEAGNSGTIPRQNPPARPKRPQNNTHNTNEYPKPVRKGAPTQRPMPKPNPQKQSDKTDTGEFPTYVRTGKGGYHPPKSQKRKVSRKNRRPLDYRVKAVIAAVSAVALIFIILLLSGVRYNTYRLSDGSKVKFFGTVKHSEPVSGWISTTYGVKGSLKNDQIKYSDGSVYEGDIVNAMRQGNGKMTYKNGDVYEGTFINDKMNGSFTVHYANGDIYVGPFVNNVREGYSTISYKYSDGYDIYEGEFKADKKNGKGKLTYADGNVYEGEFVNDLKNGNGVLTYSEGDVYTEAGEWMMRELGLFCDRLKLAGTYFNEKK